ncbi:MAG: hypothetical protein IIA45_04995 [Bacteroidetes bacterium]|nr:hypothetical protein [Bacteroidota bacterium]
MDQDVIIIALAALSGILWLLKLRSYDIYEKGSSVKLLFTICLRGIVSVEVNRSLYDFVVIEENSRPDV